MFCFILLLATIYLGQNLWQDCVKLAFCSVNVTLSENVI